MEGRGTRTAPYREDCWSEGETSLLVEAWGDRYLELNRGSLRQQHWQEVADAVNSRAGARGRSRPLRTDAQCKNRIDTLKKKYKNEKARIAAGRGGDGGVGGWSFFSRLDVLVGPPSGPPHRKNPPASPPRTSHRNKGSSMPQASARGKKPAPTGITIDNPIIRRAATAAAAAAATSEANDLDDDEEGNGFKSPSVSSSKKKRRARELARDELRELARAIESFAEKYERAEEAKQEQRTELEKKRMEFTKGLELQRMQIFVDSQVQLAKIKRAKPSEQDSYRLN